MKHSNFLRSEKTRKFLFPKASKNDISLLHLLISNLIFILKTLIFFILSFHILFGQSYSLHHQGVLAFCDSLETIGKKYSQVVKVAESYYIRGKVKAAYYEIEESNKLFIKALKIQEKEGDLIAAAKTYNQLCTNAGLTGQSSQYLFWLQELESIEKKIGIDKKRIDLDEKKGFFYMRGWLDNPKYAKPIYDSALFYWHKTLVPKQAQTKADSEHLSSSNGYIGRILLQLKNKNAINYLEWEEKFNPNSQYHLLKNYLAQSNYYFAFDDLTNANIYVKKAVQLQTSLNNLDNEIKLPYNQVLYNYFSRIEKKPKVALMHQSIINKINNDILLSDQKGAVSRLNIEFETKKKDALIAKKENDLQIQSRNVLFLSIGLILILGIGSLFFGLYQKNKSLNERNRLLVQEVNHRVKNNLQVVSSLLNLQKNEIGNEEARNILNESQLRVQTMVLIHSKLYGSKKLELIEMEPFVGELCLAIFQSFGYYEVKCDLIIKLELLEADKAILLGLILNEWLTNICKYVFKVSKENKLEIELIELGESIILKINDFGGKKIEEIKTSSFGIKLIKMLVEQLNGKIELNNLGNLSMLTFKK